MAANHDSRVTLANRLSQLRQESQEVADNWLLQQLDLTMLERLPDNDWVARKMAALVSIANALNIQDACSWATLFSNYGELEVAPLVITGRTNDDK